MKRLQKGILQNILILFLLSLLLLVFLTPAKRYVYLIYQNTAFKFKINLNNIASPMYVDWIKSQSESFQANENATFLGKSVNFRQPQTALSAQVLGETPSQGERWIDINLSEQRLYMKEGGTTVASFLISSGKWAPTPTGEFHIWTKLRYTRMAGGSKALGTFYDLPNVPYTMYFYQGYGMHGTYWHNNFGHPMSHGCVNMKTEEAAVVYNWASVGTRVVVHT